MISVNKIDSKHGLCNSCFSDHNVQEITFYQSSQGIAVVLCEECRKELMEKLKGADDE